MKGYASANISSGFQLSYVTYFSFSSWVIFCLVVVDHVRFQLLENQSYMYRYK